MFRSSILLLILFLSISSSILVQSKHTYKYSPKHTSKYNPKQASSKNTSKNSTKSLQLPKLNTPSNPTDAFCKSFVKQCYHEALNGKNGEITVEIACQRQGRKYSSNYIFECKADRVDLTKAVLNEIGGGYTVTVTSQGSTKITTDYVTDVQTSTSTTTQEVDNITTTDVYNNQTTTTTDIGSTTETVTINSTTLIPVTATTTSISTVVTTSPLTTTIATSTVVQYALNNETVQIVRVALSPSIRRKRMNKVDSSEFCSAYSTGCQQGCKRVNSSPKHLVCHSTTLYNYSLTCYCKNGKIETQHALAAAVNQEHISSVSTISTSTAYATVTSTTVIPTTVLSTSYITKTSTIPVTSTYTSLSTATQTSFVTSFTGTPTTVATTTPISTTTNTVTSVISTTATTTTQVIIAPTGAVQALDSNGTSQGYLGLVQNYNSYVVALPSLANATTWAAVKDSNSSFFKLQALDGSGNTFLQAEYNSNQRGGYTVPVYGPDSDCGSAARTAGPGGGHSPYLNEPCEVYVFDIVATNQTINNGYANLLNEYYPPNSTSPMQYTWFIFPYNEYQILGAVQNLDSFNSAQGDHAGALTLQFPIPTS